MRRALRIAVVLALSLYGFAATLPDISIVWRPLGTFGLSTDLEGRVRDVAPDSSAAHAGIVPGDRVSGLTTIPVSEVWVVQPGVTRTVNVEHGGQLRTVTLVAQPTKLPAGGALTYPLGKLLGAFFIAAGMFLVLVRPGLATWGFFLYCVGANPFDGWYRLAAALSPGAYLGFSIADDFMNALGIVGLLVFALCFPKTQPWAWRERALRYLPAVLAFTVLLSLSTELSAWLAQPPPWFLAVYEVWFGLLFVATAAIFIDTYLRTHGQERERVAWASFGMILGMAGLAIADLYGAFDWSVFSSAGWLVRLTPLLVAAVPATLVYAAIRHRVFDFSLAVNRTLIYGALTSLVVVIFAILHSLAVRTVSANGFGLGVELGAAIAIGFSFNAMHARVSGFVDSVFFRARRKARQRLECAAEAVAFVSTASLVDDVLETEPRQALGLASAAVFRSDDSVAQASRPLEREHFVRRRAHGWAPVDCDRLDGDDMLVLLSRTQGKPLRLADIGWERKDVPSGAAAPEYAVPVLAGRRLTGVALYGSHRRGDELDSDEVAMISELAVAAGAAYERIEAQALRHAAGELHRLRRELAALKQWQP